MKKILSILKLIFINIILLIILFFISDYIFFITAEINQPKWVKKHYFQYLLKNVYVYDCSKKPFDGSDNIGESGRLPDGLEYRNKKPIVIFGCSYAYGQYLNPEQTFSYKLAHLLKKPVYNRAGCAWGLQHMYMQITSDNFYKDIPDTNNVIYMMLDDHFRRMLGETTFVSDDYFYPYYSLKNNQLVYLDYNNSFLNFFRSSYTLKFIRMKYKNHYWKNTKNIDKITDFALTYFIKSREYLESKLGHKVNFYVILYDFGIPYQKHKQILIKKLQENNFIILDSADLTNEILYAGIYHSKKTNHPTEAAWDLITPKVAEILNKYN